MMEVELPPAKQLQQDMDLIDILWKQDIDLGVGREVFDYSQRQKEYELEKQKKLEKEHQEQLLKEQEKALYAHVQLDEETGEYIPVQPPAPMEAAVVTHTVTSSLQSKSDLGQQLSFDECMKILADTFLVNPETTFQIAMAPDAQIDTSQSFLTTEHPVPDSLQNSTANPENVQEMEQAWEELLSIPELQCLGNQIDNLVDLSLYSNSDAMLETSNYMFHNPLVNIEKPVEDAAPVFANDFVGPFASNVPTVNTNSTFNVESFCDDIFTLIDPKVTNVPLTDNSGQPFTQIVNEPVDITDLSLCKAFKGNSPAEFNDSDSGISINTSPCSASPGQSMGSSIYGDAHYGYSDSEMEDMDSKTEDVQQNPSEKFSMPFTEDAFYALSPFVPLDTCFDIEAQNPPEKDLPVKPGQSKTPFTKDKLVSQQEARFSRDEQRAKALNVPFSVDTIVNLPVDDFNVLMSKHQFNEAQLALIRDIRRRGKNKVAAQNCRKRKMENIVELESDLDKLKYEKEKLLAENGEYNDSLRLLKKQLGTLYMDVFSKLRDEDGNPYSLHEYSLQQTKDGNVFLVPKANKIEIKKEEI
ncbi:LOW QUALITY PROTEIN: nuclear factor erythroid 2-related factor 2 [Bufo gargarizans]|uniref:LOW QUALITY PROTEIN: nuclear factor erythroid 2-related factor 2 n=1 Tax=Bufo gargarizans TaxID=30331 RepID=UPI001CF1B249|nr:LOW QUALITY PROTEIN: nuclear factor erythroid 2-related factor 2 [Bufo gargarizans]